VTPLEARLAELAARHQTVTYGDLAREFGVPMSTLTAELEVLMEDDAAKGAPFRAALCSGRLLNGQPAAGFFQKAAALGRLSSAATPAEQAAFVATERAALFTAAR
jgi:hypothetical protein